MVLRIGSVHAASAAAARSIGAGGGGFRGMVRGSLHADAGSGNQSNVFCRIARWTNDILFDFADFVENIVCLPATGTLIIIDGHGECLPLLSIA